ncbi:multifunctional oxoglutarate decarboxylase/oxoglutarate dehydrogenase thiamine pyrophosphate-binding subunit/dihydrolipoyllysine-residue succinyltransferase subunit [Leucobacter sp. CSA1]|uniref:Multifunctional oxoglutarate decarboxylase/oxoglutarate dehydrogenase thiamine pyrophosphate-binding subunit/dihydrolipoyllysine-residue succinyltransferase subunit n=1 Tax=Leucobacter chromiisoli TaxID=2796471 RepID=A0A934Q9L1_9MICO|nr:multifunctional oxoglutarate decarboxylase/oxoglutarate dehydrogenase thiamine pyrophosphate-binding subunit/dihydrolipoyllysine-residue succinyltransferase subunit [Leucobacter chromiisoli]MBK0419686.1 multifunctional oxoglutarate decarboxylase/oxoglutarate dehydrogenase thiamine pyrophosphate-binding subunit/dihydrolipoyllysine-residue succinyltransferase subunit [Leucobacter chromiisoli]
MAERTDATGNGGSAEDFGANAWLVDELYKQYVQDKNSVDRSWWPVLERYKNGSGSQPAPGASQPATGASQAAAPSAPAASNTPAAPATSSAPAAPSSSAPSTDTASTSTQPARTTNAAPREAPIPADAPRAAPATDVVPAQEDAVTPMRGMARTLSKNMDQSLTVPTATSVRTIPAKLLIDNRIVINNHLRRSRGGKVSFTHLIGWALIQTLKDFPSQNVAYAEVDGKPSVVVPAHVGLGIAIDVPKPDGTRSLLVPSIKRAETLNFNEYLAAYEDLVKRARDNKLGAADFQGTTLSLTNPGGIGTEHSVPRLMRGQGCIIGAGALDYPAEFQGASQEVLTNLGIGKTITLTSTYDHRVIQGAGSGEFLKIVHERLTGGHRFYEEIFAALRIPYKPVQWAPDIHVDISGAVDKTARVQELINSFRVRGHLMADIDPLEYVQRTHPDLEIESHGLTFWDLDREFVTGGIGGKRTMKLRDILGVLRDSYCRKIGIEYMHIQDPEQRRWLREQLEVPYAKPSHDEQMRILEKLNEAEAFETFLQTKYVGQKRFSLEGGESVIPLLDAMLIDAAEDGVDSVDIGMAHRGRLNVLSNIAGKTYGQIFREFEGQQASRTGSGDVKYHLGTTGVFTAPNGTQVPIHLAANPSHLETVDGVLEGIVRAKQDLKPIGSFTTLPVLIHGDAAMAGQGVVYETLQMAQLRGYRTGGTLHIIINNQVGFTTLPSDSRSSVYSSDIGKVTQAPIFHVNGDDPESVVRVARLAYEFRQRFHKDVVIDLVCYRRRGHNEGDDPSMTQPLMTDLIEAKRSTRRLYTSSLVGRGDITEEEYEKAKQDFQDRLERAFQETHAAQTGSIPIIDQSGIASPAPAAPAILSLETAVDRDVIERIGDAHGNKPEGFTVHQKLQQLLNKRVQMSREGGIDWGFGELLALGSLLMEGTAVRFAGQDARRGTFAQRHAVFHDRSNGQEWLPLLNLAENQARFWIYDSLLSEYAALAFEYGYSLQREDALVLWEAQFGDFVNGAQSVVDEFISSAEQKWGQQSSVVMLLPHGYEGQGPDHSSARIERFLQLCAENNMTVTRPSTPANYFHLLRRQAYARPRKPLIVFTPKSMLRLRGATSSVEDFTTGSFQPVIDDPRLESKADAQRVILTSGKVYYDLLQALDKNPDPRIALVRVEQFYPIPSIELGRVLAGYRNAELVWVQDEPENQGAWPFIALELSKHLKNDRIRGVSRPASAAPSTGSAKVHAVEQEALIAEALRFDE